MSHDATNWAVKQRGIPPAAKVVLWQLCDRYHPDNGCFPSQELLADDCEMSRSALNDHLKALEEAGLIRRERRQDRGTKRRRSTRYRFAFEDDFGAGEAGEPCPESGHGAMSENGAEPCPKSGESHVRNPDTNPVREPVKEPEERERAARDRSCDREEEPEPQPAEDDGKSSDGRTEKAFLKIWPTAGVDNRERIHSAWMKLTPQERTLAIDHVPDWLEANRRAGRKTVISGSTYLRGKPWELAAEMPKAQDDGPVILDRWSRAWWAYLFAMIQAENLRRVGIMVSTAQGGGNWQVKAGEAPGAEAVGALVQICSTSEEWAAWDGWLRERGVSCRIWDREQWIWVPSRWPPGHSAGSGEAVRF